MFLVYLIELHNTVNRRRCAGMRYVGGMVLLVKTELSEKTTINASRNHAFVFGIDTLTIRESFQSNLACIIIAIQQLN